MKMKEKQKDEQEKEKKLYLQSITETIKRSQINFAAYNPKRHSKESINKIKKNIKKVAFLGGIVWNRTTGNLIDGHKRIMALDVIHNYNSENENKTADYEIKVEAVELDEKTEKEQNIFQTQSRTDFDVELMQQLIPEIDFNNAGLEIEDLNYFMVDISNIIDNNNNEIKDDFDNLEFTTDNERKMKKIESVKNAKNSTKQKMQEETTGTPFVTLSFDNYENKVFFMELINCPINNKYVKGEILLEYLDKTKKN